MIKTISDIIDVLGKGSFIRKKYPTGKCDIELLHPNKDVDILPFELYHKFRNRGLGECKATPSKNGGAGDGLFTDVPGHDQYYYYGLSDLGQIEFYKSQKRKKFNET